jgi:hypothetical protein
MAPFAVRASQATGIDPRIIIAQSAQETGWGRSAPNFNFFGIKSHGAPGGATMRTKEFGPGGEYSANESFRSYASMEDSAKDYADFINRNPRYQSLRSAQGLDPQLAALQKSGYATDPNYARSVGSIARNINLDGIPQEQAAAPTAQAQVIPDTQPTAQQPAAPVYANDFTTMARRAGNFLAPSLVDAPAALTPEQIAAQQAATTANAETSRQYNTAAAGLLNLARLSAQPGQAPMMQMLQNEPVRGQYRPIPRTRGLL